VDDNTLSCDTPSFETFGAKKVNVVISINKQDYTITMTEFQYYLNTKAENCIVYGPGALLDHNVAGETTQFIIQARNTQGYNRESGADKFVIRIIRPDKIRNPEDEEEQAKEEERPGT